MKAHGTELNRHEEKHLRKWDKGPKLGQTIDILQVGKAKELLNKGMSTRA